MSDTVSKYCKGNTKQAQSSRKVIRGNGGVLQ